MYELTNQGMYPNPGMYQNPVPMQPAWPPAKHDSTLAIALVVVAVLVVAAVVYFSKRGYYYSLERDKEGRITGIMEKPMKG